MTTIFSTNQYQKAVGVEIKTLEFKYGKSELRVHYSIDKVADHFHVGQRSSFGHIEFVRGGDFTSVHACLNLLFQHIEQRHKRFTVKFAPLFYFPTASNHIIEALKHLGKHRVTGDCNQSMLIADEGDVVNNFSRSNRRVYKKLKRSGYKVCTSSTLLPEGYAILAENRGRRNVALSLQYDALQAQAQQLNGCFHFFECRTENNMLSAYAVTLRLSSEWLYVFYWGERVSERMSSPVVILAAEIMRYCQREGINRLDAGTSSVLGELDQPLFDFKRRLGFVASPKFTVSDH